MTEEWRPVEGWPYEVSDEGRVRRSSPSLSKSGVGVGFLRTSAQPRRYPKATLFRGDQRWYVSVHTLVAKAFLPAPPGPIGNRIGEYCVNHKNNRRDDNRASNLEWVTPGDNIRHAWRIGAAGQAVRRGTAHPCVKLTEESVRAIRARHQNGERFAALALAFGVSDVQIRRIVQRRRWAHVA